MSCMSPTIVCAPSQDDDDVDVIELLLDRIGKELVLVDSLEWFE